MKNKPFKILVTDDDQKISFMIASILRRDGFTVVVAKDAIEAVRLFAIKPDYFDVLITDHEMPMVSGLDLVAHLRANDVQVKVIVMSGALTEELLRAYRSRHVGYILQKPFMPVHLSSTVNNILGPRDEALLA